MLIAPLAGALLGAFSASKLGPHVLGDVNDTGAQTIVGACPRVVKWMTPDGRVASEISRYRTRCPGGQVVLRVYVPSSVRYATSQGAEGAADDFWARMQGGLSGISPAQVDWLEGPNELDNLPDWYHDLNAANWFALFWSRLADRMNAAGYNPLVGSIAVGNPSLAGETGAGSLNFFKPVADAMKPKKYRWGWSYHAYTKDLLQDVSQESWYSLRYRRIRTECNLAGVPLVLTEGGQDIPTGWQGRGTTASAFMGWLRWFDARMKEDADVVGVTLFQVGQHADWQNFDLGPVANELAALLRSSTVDGGAVVPDAGTGFDGGGRPDAGAGADAGTAADAGSSDLGGGTTPDAGAGRAGSGGPPDGVGLGCASAPLGLAWLALLGLSTWQTRRRRRRSTLA